MQTFHDIHQRQWTLRVTVGIAQKLKADIDVDIQGVLDGSLLARIVEDRSLLGQILWVLCEAQAEGMDVSPEEFANSLDSDVLDEAADKMIEELIGFFPKLRREPLKTIWGQAKTLAEAELESSLRKIEEGGEIKASTGNSSATKAPES